MAEPTAGDSVINLLVKIVDNQGGTEDGKPYDGERLLWLKMLKNQVEQIEAGNWTTP
jgi:hypothetical protein